jgi:hypothetical protein
MPPADSAFPSRALLCRRRMRDPHPRRSRQLRPQRRHRSSEGRTTRWLRHRPVVRRIARRSRPHRGLPRAPVDRHGPIRTAVLRLTNRASHRPTPPPRGRGSRHPRPIRCECGTADRRRRRRSRSRPVTTPGRPPARLRSSAVRQPAPARGARDRSCLLRRTRKRCARPVTTGRSPQNPVRPSNASVHFHPMAGARCRPARRHDRIRR